jgi:hypothetical protein
LLLVAFLPLCQLSLPVLPPVLPLWRQVRPLLPQLPTLVQQGRQPLQCRLQRLLPSLLLARPLLPQLLRCLLHPLLQHLLFILLQARPQERPLLLLVLLLLPLLLLQVLLLLLLSCSWCLEAGHDAAQTHKQYESTCENCNCVDLATLRETRTAQTPPIPAGTGQPPQQQTSKRPPGHSSSNYICPSHSMSCTLQQHWDPDGNNPIGVVPTPVNAKGKESGCTRVKLCPIPSFETPRFLPNQIGSTSAASALSGTCHSPPRGYTPEAWPKLARVLEPFMPKKSFFCRFPSLASIEAALQHTGGHK